ncbi:von Willebrand factor type A domain containing protein [Elaphomyces granulatus]
MNIDIHGRARPGICWDPQGQGRPHNEPAGRPHGAPADQRPGQGQQEAAENLRPEAGGFLPPISTKVEASIVLDVAKVSCSQSFENNSNTLIPQASYTFPLPTGCTVVNFCCLIGTDRRLIGMARPNAEATGTFEDAVRRNAAAGLLEQNTPEIFTSRLGNIPANTQVKAELSFIIQLKQRALNEFCFTTLSLPVFIAPRYGHPPEQLRRRLGRSSQLRQLRAEVSILAATDLVDINSPSHAILTEIGGTTAPTWEVYVANQARRSASVTLDDETVHLDRDFILDIVSNQEEAPDQPVACMERHPDDRSHAALMLKFPPKFWLTEQTDFSNSEIIFVADRSGSMIGNQNSLKSSSDIFVMSLPASCRFNLWSFGSTHRSLWQNSQEYTNDSRREAQQYLENQARVCLGGTELLPALKAVCRSRHTDCTTDIIVLTDGKVWNTSGVIQFARDTMLQSNREVRFFCLGIGDGVSYELIEGIARAGGGYAEVIRNAAEGGWGERVVAVLEAASTAHVGPPSSIEVHWDEAAVGANQTVISQSPAYLSDISLFLQNRVFMLLENVPRYWARVWLNIRTIRQGREIDTEVPVNVVERPDTIIHLFAARALLGDLETGRSRIHQGPQAAQRGSREEQRLAREEGERLGCRWSLASRWTSFVAVEMTEEQVPLGFGDRDELEAQEPELNLLRRRAVGPILPTDAENDEDSDDDGDEDSDDDSNEDSDSDFSIISRGHLSDSNGGSDSDDDDPGMDNPGAGAAGSQGSGGVGHGGHRGHQEGRGGLSGGQGQGRPKPPSSSRRGQSQHARPSTRTADDDHLGKQQIKITRSSDPHSQSNPSTQAFATFDLKDFYKSSKRKFGKSSGFSSYRKSTRYSIGRLDSDLESLSLFGKVATTPSNNMPASTSLKAVSAFIPSSPEAMAKRQLVTQIVEFQAFDGPFVPHRAPINKSDPSSLAELLGPGMQTLVEIMRDIAATSIMLQRAEVAGWTVAIRALLEIHFAAHRELWMLVHKKSSVFLDSLVSSERLNPDLPKKLLEMHELANSSIDKARFYAFPSTVDKSLRPRNWEKVLSKQLQDHILIPLQLPPTKTDPLQMEEAQYLGRILPKDPLQGTMAMKESAMYKEYTRDPVLKGRCILKQRIREYEEALERLSEARKKGGSKKNGISVKLSPADGWVTMS